MRPIVSSNILVIALLVLLTHLGLAGQCAVGQEASSPPIKMRREGGSTLQAAHQRPRATLNQAVAGFTVTQGSAPAVLEYLFNRDHLIVGLELIEPAGTSEGAPAEAVLSRDCIAAATPLDWEGSADRDADWHRLEVAGSIQLDAETGDYRIHYTTPRGEEKTWVFEPANKLEVEVHADVSYDPSTGAYTYTYTVRNDPASIQSLCKVSVAHPGAEIWNASALPDDPEVEGGWHFAPTALRGDLASWGHTEAGGLGMAPGETAVFSFQSDSGPGTVSCFATGYVPTPSFSDYEAPVDPRPLFTGQSAQGVTLGPTAATGADVAAGYVSLRPLLSSLGWSLTWEAHGKRVIARQKDRTLSVEVGSDDIVLNGVHLAVQRPARVTGNRVRVSAELINHLDPGLAREKDLGHGTT